MEGWGLGTRVEWMVLVASSFVNSSEAESGKRRCHKSILLSI